MHSQPAGDVRLVLDFSPWRLLLPLRRLRLGANGLFTLYSANSSTSDLGLEICAGLQLGKHYRLQMDLEESNEGEKSANSEALEFLGDQAYFNAELSEKRETSTGWELQFKLSEKSRGR